METETAAREGATVDELKSKIASFTVGYITITIKLSGAIYRGRKNKQEEFSHVQQLWYPKSKGNRQGRANQANAAVFYCSDSLFAVIRELAPSIGQKITTLRCEARSSGELPRVFCIGFTQKIVREGRTPLGGRIEPDFDLRKYPEERLSSALLIDSFFSRLFRSVNDEFFNLTNAIAEFYMEPNRIDGLIYPSVKEDGGLNVAFKTAAADKFYCPAGAFEDQLEGLLAANKLKMRRVGSAEIGPVGNLLWKRAAI